MQCSGDLVIIPNAASSASQYTTKSEAIPTL